MSSWCPHRSGALPRQLEHGGGGAQVGQPADLLAILQAEGKKEAAFREAEARERLAQAEAKATELVSTAISQGDVQAINYFVAQKYVEALGKFADSPNQKLMILPTEVTGVMGSIAGIAELAKASLDKSQPSNKAK